MSESVFPQELYDIIISLCDQRSLVSCCLVCRTWVPSSRIRLFANLRPLIISPTSLPQALQLVDNSASTISPYIRSLVLKDWDNTPAHSESPGSWSSSRSFHALLPRITGRMVAVETLAFHATDWEEMADGALKFLVFTFKDSLKTLEVRDCSCRTFSSLVSLACSFSVLENLSLHRLVRLDPKAIELDGSPSLEHLRGIHVHGYIKKELVQWIMATKRVEIEVVTIGPLLPGEARSVGKFLKSLKNNLRQITLSGESTPNLHRDIDLKYNRLLTSIHFTNLMLHHRGSEGRASMNWFIHILRAIQSSSVRSLHFSICMHSKSVETLEGIDWLALRSCLDKPQFVCLTCVEFTFSMSRHKEAKGGRWWNGYEEMAGRFLRDQLPQYQGTEILRCDFERSRFDV
ncbi:hypothetical protein DFH09DRAFT_1326016 [Mycena vulgaris]|nr:hypothetical protein DFH09DRAFT_1326016 [Mycena vulgaris]